MVISEIITIIIVVIFSMLTIGLIFARLYKRASKEISFVRTGMGGQKVIMNGGALVLPVLHELIHVNMNTLRLEVRRANEQALITRDRMRVDVTAEFYVRVKPIVEAIADAAQTLGRRTLDPQQLKELIEGKFVDSLRAVAAEMAMEELHEQRVNFVQKVQAAVSEDLLKNGLELESVSLTSLDQTNRDFFNPQNAFDAEGLTRLTEEIESRRKQRNDIEQDTSVKVGQKNLEAEKERLSLAREEEYAKLGQQREIEVRKAEEEAETSIRQAERKRYAEEAIIESKRQVDLSRIIAEREVEEQSIEKERLIKEKDISRARSIESADIEKQKTVELSNQDRQIAIAEKSKEQSLAKMEAEQARSKAVKAEEEVVTVRATEIASRNKEIELIKAQEEAEKKAIDITVKAESEKRASVDKAEAVKIEANALAEKERIRAKAESDAEIMLAQSAKQRYEVDAIGTRALHEAENILSNEIITMKVKLSIIENLAQIITASAKPMEAIDDIKIIQVAGLNAVNSGGISSGGSSSASSNLAEEVVNSALRYRTQAPLIDAILKEVGLEGSDITGFTKILKENLSSEKKQNDSIEDKS
ncbi:MAG: flotillin family protein [Bacteroidetes bacterium]|nr:flotillin family protein [Bacteroidota bacterium]MBU1116933.1 flotillin family protein [Bacteroidota bacterium]MBU1799399.1 flotillin family protein [Bacteroidota bacterium]